MVAAAVELVEVVGQPEVDAVGWPEVDAVAVGRPVMEDPVASEDAWMPWREAAGGAVCGTVMWIQEGEPTAASQPAALGQWGVQLGEEGEGWVCWI